MKHKRMVAAALGLFAAILVVPVGYAADTAGSEESDVQRLKQDIQEQARELEAQRSRLREQQQRLDALEQKLGAPASTPAAGTQPSQSQQELSEKVEKIEKELAESKKSTDGLIKSIGPFSFSGDIRLRHEAFFGGGTSAKPLSDRQRERFRLRFNANAKLNDEFAGGLTLASGDPGTPTSTNQSFTGNFTRKPINIDKAFVTYTPDWYKPLEVTGGKWAYTWYRTELTWDNDLNPEGFSEALTYKFKDSYLERVRLVGLQLPFNEVAGGPNSTVMGGQIQATGWKLHERAKLSTYLAYYNFQNPNSAASVLGANNTNANNFIGGVQTFASKFGIVDAIARLDIDTGYNRFPLMLQLDFAQNTGACQNLRAFVTAGVPVTCKSSDRQAYWAEAQIGRTQEPGDVRFGYTFIRIEQEAVLGAFNFDDLRQPTNVVDHRLEAFYQAYKNITLGFTGFYGRALRASPPSVTERYLKRFQFDLMYKF